MDNEFIKRMFKYTQYVDKKNWKDLPDNVRLKFGEFNDEAGLFIRPDCNIIAIDGSSDIKEWIGNFGFASNDKGFHTNFYNSAQALQLRVKHLLNNDSCRNRITYTVGYSRGGAIAQCLTYLLRNECCVTFGSPKCSKKNMNIKHIRITNFLDIVPTLPPFPYKHFDNQHIKLKGKGLGHQTYYRYFE